MNIKRILATILTFAMVMTSGISTSTVFAAEVDEMDVTMENQIVEETTEDLSSEIISEVTDETEQTEEIGEETELLEESVLSEEVSEEGTEEVLSEDDVLLDEDTGLGEELISEEADIDFEAALQDTAAALQIVLNPGSANTDDYILQWKIPADSGETVAEKNATRYRTLSESLYLPELPSAAPATATLTIPDNFFEGDYYLKYINTENVDTKLTVIGKEAFKNCNNLTAFSSPSALTEIKDGAFSGTGALKDITLNNVVAIGKEAFKNSAVTSATGTSCTEIGESAFNGCSFLRDIDFTKVTKIEESAFSGCSVLENVTLPAADNVLNYVGDFAFKGTAVRTINWKNYKFSGTDYLGNGVFSDCASLAYIYLPAIEAIPASTCANCKVLATVLLNSQFADVTTSTIKSNAFNNCPKLTKINLGLVHNVETTAFSGDSNLVEVKFENETEDRVVDDSTTPKKMYWNIDLSAFPNLSTPKNLKMYGYVDAVHNYSDKKEYTFVSLYSSRKISKKVSGSGISVSISPTTAKAGDLVTVSVSMTDSSHLLNAITISGETSGELIDAWLDTSSESKAVFKFYMPNSAGFPDENIKVTCEAKKTSDMKSDFTISNFKALEAYDGGYTPTGGNGNYTVDKSGREFLLHYRNGYEGIGDKNWQCIFKSNDESVIRVDSLGYVTAVGKGSAYITATMKNSSNKLEIKFTVGDDVKIKSVVMDPITPSRAELSETKDTKNHDKIIPIISIEKSYVAKSAFTFPVYINAKDVDDNYCIATPSYWSSVDSKVAKVSSSKSYDNIMNVTVPKGAVGETMIMAYALNPGESKVNQNSGEYGEATYTDNLAKLIIRVVDATPRLTNKSFNVDYNSSIGTKLELIEVYDALGEINKETPLSLVQKKTVNKQIVYSTPDNFGIEIKTKLKDGVYVFYAKKNDAFKPKSGATVSYKNMYIQGSFKNSPDEKFYIPLEVISISNIPLAPTVTLKGKINTWYGVNGLEDRDKITVTQSLKKNKIVKVELRDKAHLNNPEDPEHDKFGGNHYTDGVLGDDPNKPGNFELSLDPNDNSKIYIKMNHELEKLWQDKNNKNVVSGYLLIYYEGYDDPVKTAITVSCADTAPKYVLSSTSGKMNYYAKDQKVELTLYKKGDSKKKPISMFTADGWDNPTFNFVATTTGNTFKNTIETTTKTSLDGTYQYTLLTLNQDNDYRPIGGKKAVIRIRNNKWAEGNYIDYTYKLSVDTKQPTAKIYGSKTAVLNIAVPSHTSTVKIYSSQENVPISKRNTSEYSDVKTMIDSVEYTGNKKNKTNAEAIKDNLNIYAGVDEETGKTMLFIEANYATDVPKGKYTFKITPIVDYNPGATTADHKASDSVPVKAIAFTVDVQNKAVTLTMKSSFTFNKDCAGFESVTSKYTLKNIPAGTKQRDFMIDLTGATVSKEKAKTPYEFGDIVDAQGIRMYPDDDPDVNNCYATIKLQDISKYETFGYTYVVSGAKLMADNDEDGTYDDEIAEIAKFKVKINLKSTKYKFSIKASGSINMIDTVKSSAITYTSTAKNFTTDIESVELFELDDKTGQQKSTNEFFELSRDFYNPKASTDIKDQNKVYITLKKQTDEDKLAVPGKKYKARLVYHLSALPSEPQYFNIDIVVKQTLPGIKIVEQDINKIYAGQKDATRTINLKIKPTSDASLEDVVGVDFKNGKDDTYYQAFTINNDFVKCQERDGNKYPMYIDYTNPKKPLKMYTAVDSSATSVYDLGQNQILRYVDTSIDKYVKYDKANNQFIYHKKSTNEQIKIKRANAEYDTYADIKPDIYYTFSMKLNNSSALVLDKQHSVKLVTKLDQQAKDTKGKEFTVKVTVYK